MSRSALASEVSGMVSLRVRGEAGSWVLCRGPPAAVLGGWVLEGPDRPSTSGTGVTQGGEGTSPGLGWLFTWFLTTEGTVTMMAFTDLKDEGPVGSWVRIMQTRHSK